MKHRTDNGIFQRSMFSFGRRAILPAVLLFSACSSGGESGPGVNSPLSTPMALVINQDDTTMTTVRLDGKGSPVVSTLLLGSAQPDAIGGVTFSLGEWIFVTHAAGNRVATIDPIGALTPILEDFLPVGISPKRIYRDPLDKEVVWTMNEVDDPTTCALFTLTFSSVSVLHNSHIAVGGDKPRLLKTSCLWGKGEQRAAFVRPTPGNPAITRQDVFVASKDTGLITLIKNDPSDGPDRYSRAGFINLCDGTKQACPASALSANQSAPIALEWSQAIGKLYCYLSGYRTIVEINPATVAVSRTVDVGQPVFGVDNITSVGLTPDGQFLFLVGEDLSSDPTKVIGKFGVVDLTASPLSVTTLSIPELENIRPARFLFTPDGTRLYLTQSNSTTGLTAQQDAALNKDKLLVFDPSTLPVAPAFVGEIPLPAADMHAMDLWITGPQGAGSAKGVVVTNATAGINGTVSLIDAASNTRTTDIQVGRNPKQVTVYYFGLAANDNQATPTW